LRRLGTATCVAAALMLAPLASARATPLTVGNVPVRFSLKRGFHPGPSTRALALVYRVTFGGCEKGPPPFAGYVLDWAPRRLTVTLLLRPVPPPAPGKICPDVVWAVNLVERITLPHALGTRTLYDGAPQPPRRVRSGG
jgi:hypothetical protein